MSINEESHNSHNDDFVLDENSSDKDDDAKDFMLLLSRKCYVGIKRRN